MKITLINPPQSDSKYKFIGVVAPPLGLAYMAAVLEENNIEVNIIDASAMDMTWEELETEIANSDPQVIAITALTPTISQALQSASIAKKTCPEATVVMGGYHPTFNYRDVLENDFVDVVIRGEGEITLLEMVKALINDTPLSEVEGIAFGDVVTPDRPLIHDLDSLPFPALHLLPMEYYKLLNMKTNMATMITSRGCPMQCSFCSSASMHGAKMRMRSTQNIVDEMEFLIKEYQVETLAFMDDTFTLNRKKVKEVCDEIIKRGLKVMWGCTARVDTLSEDLIATMKEAGCIAIFMGVESADQQTLDAVNKQTSIDKIRKAFEMSQKQKMRTIASVVLGMPGDTRESIKNTVKFVKELKPSYAIFSLATPYPGTRFYQQAFEKNLIKVRDWSKYTLISPIIETMGCSLEELRKLQAGAFVQFYLRPGYILRQVLMDGPILLRTIFGVFRRIV